jgi:hypothetical protein
LKLIDGKVGDETRKALAMRVLVIEGSISRNPNPIPRPAPKPPQPRPTVTPVVPSPTPANKHWLFQAQPAAGLTPPPFFSTGGPSASVLTGQVAFGIVYRTASEGPHWEFGGAFQPSFNSQNSPTDPRYTLQLQGSVTYADPYSRGRFHTALFGQVLLLTNLAPASFAGGVQVGGQISLDIIEDKWNIFSQAGVQLAGQWTLCGGQPGGCAGQLTFGPVFTVLGTTIQWDLQ